MSNRLALVGSLIAVLSAACPSVAAAQNPWRADPQATGQYAPPQPAPQHLQMPPTDMSKYAPLDGKLISEAERTRGYPMMGGTYSGGGYNPYGYGYAPNYAPAYGGLGHSGFGYPGLGYSGLGTPGLGWGGYGPNSGLGNPYGGSGPWPGLGLGNGLGGPMSWMPFW